MVRDNEVNVEGFPIFVPTEHDRRAPAEVTSTLDHEVGVDRRKHCRDPNVMIPLKQGAAPVRRLPEEPVRTPAPLVPIFPYPRASSSARTKRELPWEIVPGRR